MKNPASHFIQLALVAIGIHSTAAMAVNWPNVPLGATNNATPMTMLVMGKDHKLFYEAYNDASDIDGDGTLDIRFKPSINYYGLYDSNLCYNYNSGRGIFEPAANAGSSGECLGSARWSGRWLNYMTTTRIDALRKVLYGGQREIDTSTETILRRSYIPQDAHSWGKEYHNLATDGYLISQYTPFSEPVNSNSRHFFGSLTATAYSGCGGFAGCSNLPPLLRVRTNVNNARIWDWASKEAPVLNHMLFTGGFPAGTGAEQNFQVRVQVCTANFNNGCKRYPNGNFKPIGILHDYGEEGKMLFGLLSGSYDRPISGGRLRKPVSSIANEITPSNGVFAFNSPLIQALNSFRIHDWNSDGYYRGGWVTNRGVNDGEFPDWGNPIGEMLYEATRYFSGANSPTPDFMGSNSRDAQMGLPTPSWDDPYSNTSQAKAAYCAKSSFLTISDVNPSYDSDQVPGSYFSGFSGSLNGFNAFSDANRITNLENNIKGLRFIGQSESNYDTAPSPKNVNSLGSIRGLAPEEPTKQGSYYSAASAFFAKTNDLRTNLKGEQTIDSYVVALSSPIPEIKAITTGGQTITVVPFGKSVNAFGISPAKGAFQPTNQIVDFYVTTIANSGPKDANPNINGGRYYAEFLVNFEDVEQGADHDMDVIARYTVIANPNNTIDVRVMPIYQSGSIQQNLGYIISGSTKDGVYLVAKDEFNSPAYFLNVPPGRSPGFCNPFPSGECANLPSLNSESRFTFQPGSNSAATILPNPLWYAAKYGGFKDINGNNIPDVKEEWDADGDGVPDTYFFVQNPLKLRDALKEAFEEIIQRSSSGGNLAANSTSLSTGSLAFQADYNTASWSGDVLAYRLIGNDTSTPVWRASSQLPTHTQRNIYLGRSSTSGVWSMSEFDWGQLNATERQALGNDNVVQYLRGDTSRELRNNGPYRNRSTQSLLGDIAHSSPAYSKETNTVFIGANDGMLHALNASTGKEVFAYIPSSLLPAMASLPQLNYNSNHQYFVDGDMAISTRSQTPNQNWLVSLLGRGGKGLFGLNVTNLAASGPQTQGWEYLNPTDSDLGFMLGKPVIGRLADGTWAVFVGNGYNSTNQHAVLYVFNLTTGALIRKISTNTGSDNGLGTPALIRTSNNRVSAAFAADLRGNIWKFDLSSAASDNWSVAFAGAPFFTARDASGAAQPITASVSVARNDIESDPNRGRWFVFFGTGSDFQTGDATSTQTQTLYGLIDKGSRITSRGDLIQRVLSQAGLDRLTGQTVRTFSQAANNDMSSRLGYFIDLPQSGERIVSAANYYKLADPTLLFSSTYPVSDVCLPGGSGYINAVNAFTGGRLANPFFDLDGDGDFAEHTLNGVAVGSVQVGSTVGKPGEVLLVGSQIILGGSEVKAPVRIKINTGIVPLTGRITWREIVRN
jgi:type IV pilus assembly protein PilY1